jgi:hypothetical protein
MKTLPLTKGQVAKVDDEDFARLSIYKWSALQSTSGGYYAVRSAVHKDPFGNKKPVTIYLHRDLVVGAPSAAPRIKFRDGDSLNCQRSNLLALTPSARALRKKSEARIQPIAMCGLDQIATHPLRGIFRDIRLQGEATGGYLVKVLGVGPGYLGSYKTIARAALIRDEEEAKRMTLALPPIPWEKVYKTLPPSTVDLLEELL